ncbi:MAG TPA: hypothetical protein VLE96_05195 [Chlamydiales bacterium]|nr:hypothetical protein [Chlamydiales bacterium]
MIDTFKTGTYNIYKKATDALAPYDNPKTRETCAQAVALVGMLAIVAIARNYYPSSTQSREASKDQSSGQKTPTLGGINGSQRSSGLAAPITTRLYTQASPLSSSPNSYNEMSHSCEISTGKEKDAEGKRNKEGSLQPLDGVPFHQFAGALSSIRDTSGGGQGGSLASPSPMPTKPNPRHEMSHSYETPRGQGMDMVSWGVKETSLPPPDGVPIHQFAGALSSKTDTSGGGQGGSKDDQSNLTSPAETLQKQFPRGQTRQLGPMAESQLLTPVDDRQHLEGSMTLGVGGLNGAAAANNNEMQEGSHS